ncbi:MAG: Integral rane protein TerC [Pedosphaera sp.]|nr:Integral rane protein TerC [Pedosphaera sp.]
MTRMMGGLSLNSVPRVRRVIVAVIGGTVLLIGICLIVLPGPAFLVIPAGLTILATEFVWARRWLHKVREVVNKAKGSLRR